MSTHVISLTRDLESIAQKESTKVGMITSDYLKSVVVIELCRIRDLEKVKPNV